MLSRFLLSTINSVIDVIKLVHCKTSPQQTSFPFTIKEDSYLLRHVLSMTMFFNYWKRVGMEIGQWPTELQCS